LRLAERLKQESTAEHTRIVATTQQTLVTQVRGALLDQQVQQETAPQVSPHDWVRIADRLQALLLSSDKEQEMSLRHPISAQDRLLLNQWIGIATQQIPQNLHALTVKIGRLEQEQSELAQALRQVPDATVASPLIETFNQLAEEKGRLQEQITLSKQTVKQAEINRAECERHIRKAEGQLAKAERLDQRVTMAAQTQLALDAYLAEMKAIKMDQLEGEVSRYFNLLCRKQGLVHEVHIDPQDYTVMLYGSNRTPIATSELSAGEKQLYAMSLLWALRSVSGRAFPIIVDTPMGRLDSEHRHALLTTFFPHAAHQVIMLATDTEVDTAAYATLQPAIAHRYQLVFDHERACTAVQYARGTQPEQPTEEAA
jgi:DNA sulfur modification protein DndD